MNNQCELLWILHNTFNGIPFNNKIQMCSAVIHWNDRIHIIRYATRKRTAENFVCVNYLDGNHRKQYRKTTPRRKAFMMIQGKPQLTCRQRSYNIDQLDTDNIKRSQLLNSNRHSYNNNNNHFLVAAALVVCI